MKSQFNKGVIEMCVLALVSQKDFYGYELVDTISQKIEISEGTIYPILRRLTQEKYFETLEEAQDHFDILTSFTSHWDVFDWLLEFEYIDW